MTHQHDPPDIRALTELGRRLEVGAAQRQKSTRRPRRTLAVAVVGLATLIAAPAVGSISGVFDSHSSIEEALPQAAAVIEPDDPVATGRALRRLGIDVRWSLVEDNPGGASPTKDRNVAVPPRGTEVLSVLRADGSSTVTEDTRALLIEIAPAGSKILESHR